jgi:outer membrane receptor protein involved in Fe transport
MRIITFGLALFCFLGLASIGAFAQTETGQIIGRVTDEKGAIIPNAAVTVKSVNTGAERTATSGDDGTYIVTNLQPGIYEVTTKGGNFAPSTQRVEITPGARVSLETPLGIVAVSGQVTITAESGVAVNTQTQELSNVVSGTQVRELPTITRNPYDLVAISGNVNPDNASGRGTGFSINGQRSASTNILLDGGENVDNFTATVGMSIPLDAVGEFRVITSNFSAEYGRASGGIVNVSTRPGGNQFHGSVYEFNRVSRLASTGFDNNARGNPKPRFTRNQFGYAIGGPIIKEKLFFFNSTEWIRVRSSQTVDRLIPAPQLISLTNARTQAIFTGTSLVATPTGTIFTVAQVCSGLGLGGGAFCSLPGTTPALREVRQVLPTDAGGGSPQNSYQTSTRIDWNMSNKTQIYGRYALQSQSFFVGSNADSPYAGFNTGSSAFNQNTIVNITHTFSPTFVSQTKLVYNRYNQQQPLDGGAVQPTYYFRNNVVASFAGRSIALPGYLPFSPGNAIPFGGPQNVGQIYEDVSKTTGQHTIRFGGTYVYMQDNRAFGAYENAVAAFGTTSYTTGFNNFVLGNLRRLQVAIDPQGKTTPGQTVTLPVSSPQFTRSNRYNEWALYLNDSWRLNERFTVNLGVRYEYYGVQHNKDRSKDSNFNYGAGGPGPGNTMFQQIANGGVCVDTACAGGGLWRPDRNNFAPRLGFAWDLKGDGRSSIRGGYGIAYERNFGNVTFNVIQNPPAYFVFTLNPGDPGFPTIPAPPPTNNFGPLGGSGGTATIVGRANIRHVNENIKNAYAHFWSASFEREVFRRTVASVEWSGSAGRSLYDLTNDNRAGLACIAGRSTDGCSFTTNPLELLNPLYYPLNTRGNKGFSNYEALIATLESSNLRSLGLQFTARYTYSAAKDNLSSTFSDSSNNFNLGLLDPFNPRLDYHYADFDVRHRFVGSFNWNLPVFNKSDNGVLRNVLGGWAINGIVNIRSGQPFTIFDCTNAAFEVCPRLVPAVPVSTKANSNPTNTNQPNTFTYVNLTNQSPGNYLDPITGTSEFGPFPANMTQKDAFRGPGLWNVDFGLYKNIKIKENMHIQLRGEFYNVFNHANMFIDGSSAEVNNCLQFDNAGNCTTAGVRSFKDGRRNIQLAAKFIF